MSIIDFIISSLAPYDCLGCECEGALLCTTCLASLPPAPPFEYNLVAVRTVHAVTPYANAAKDLVWQLKSAGAQAAARIMATAMLPLLAPGAIIVPVPTASSRVRQRGYDQAKLIARQLARQSRRPYLDCLTRIGQTDQVGADRAQRLEQLQGAFRVKKTVTNAKIVLIDDVVTTGASLQSAADVLRQAGASDVRAVTFAQA